MIPNVIHFLFSILKHICLLPHPHQRSWPLQDLRSKFGTNKEPVNDSTKWKLHHLLYQHAWQTERKNLC